MDDGRPQLQIRTWIAARCRGADIAGAKTIQRADGKAAGEDSYDGDVTVKVTNVEDASGNRSFPLIPTSWKACAIREISCAEAKDFNTHDTSEFADTIRAPCA